MEHAPFVSGVVLAAGASVRLGRPKQTLELEGRPLLRHVLVAAAASCLDEIVVVLGHGARDVAGALGDPGPRARIVVNPDHASGQASSLLAGLRATDPAARAAVVLLGDQPRVRAETIDAVVDAFRRGDGPVVQAAYGGRPGHPTLLARTIWPELQSLRGDLGARGWIARHPTRRALVEVGGEPPADVDTMEDYRQLLQEPPT